LLLGVTVLIGSVLLFLLRRSFPTETARLETMAEQELQMVEQKAKQELMKHHLVPPLRAQAAPEKAVVVEPPQQQQPAAGAGENNNSNNHQKDTASQSVSCPYTALADLSPAERYPVATAERHMVTPPAETAARGVALVCCRTTQGPLSLVVHHAWAPVGARRFLDLVESGYFSNNDTPLMRCVPHFLCQFGLNGNPDAMKPFRPSLPDDPNWLPEGPAFRQNELGVKRFARGYLAYAGAGPHSRSLQLIVALQDNGHLAGGAPWEVPWGELVGEHSYRTLDQIYTGYGEHGPKQGSLWQADPGLKAVRRNFPKLDFVQGCRVVDTTGGQGVPMSTTTREGGGGGRTAA